MSDATIRSLERAARACLHCEDQGYVCDWCGEPPGDCYCVDMLDDHGVDDEAAADRWSRCDCLPREPHA